VLTLTPAGSPGLAAARGERVLAFSAMLYRGYGLVLIIIVALVSSHRLAAGPPMTWFTVAMAAECAVVIAVCMRRQMIYPWLMTADALWIAGASPTAAILPCLP